MSNIGEKTIKLKALTDIITGDVEGQSESLIYTGLLGSLRWWFEVLVRGMGGNACDPSCSECQDLKHCVVCELFGCTGWSRKFKFEVLDQNGENRKSGANNSQKIKKDAVFSFRFIPLRPIRDEEWVLLDATLRLISDYGALGGKTVFKPSDEKNRAHEFHHSDFGLISIIENQYQRHFSNFKEVKNYLLNEHWIKASEKNKEVDFRWASLKYFWFVGNKTLSRENSLKSNYNRILGRKESKHCKDCGKIHLPHERCNETKKHPKRKSDYLIDNCKEEDRWLAGTQTKSKKVFSFKKPARTYGFVNPAFENPNLPGYKNIEDLFANMENRLKSVWGDTGWNFDKGCEIINRLF